MVDWIIAADVALGVLKDLAIGIVGGVLLTAAVRCVEALTEQIRDCARNILHEQPPHRSWGRNQRLCDVVHRVRTICGHAGRVRGRRR
jgi:hypothetical protein